ncbi:carbohydrate ABC transporter permease [Halomicroarcula sp. GCM10025709]|uniref:carbohydrate ABC transporter permease n=1 Tax=Halomicroarcula sp. GCM10025709 TaxID=3252669 RepID=UPI003623DDDD
MARSDYEYPGYDRTGVGYWSKTTLLYAAVTAGALWMTLPFWWTLTTSLSATPTASAVSFIPAAPTLENFVTLWERPDIPLVRWFINTVIFAGAVTTFNLIFDSLAGYSLAKINFWGRDKLFLGFISTMMIPAMVTLIPVYLILTQLGWINTYQGLIAPLVANPLGIFLLRQHFKSLPSAQETRPRLTGATSSRPSTRSISRLRNPHWQHLVSSRSWAPGTTSSGP